MQYIISIIKYIIINTIRYHNIYNHQHNKMSILKHNELSADLKKHYIIDYIYYFANRYSITVDHNRVREFIESVKYGFSNTSLNLELRDIDNDDFMNIINALLGLDSLREICLKMKSNKLSNVPIIPLQKFCLSKNILSLDIAYTKLTIDSITNICKIFNNEKINSIDFGILRYSTDAISSIVQLYKNNQNIKMLKFSCSYKTDVNNHIEMLSEILYNNNIESVRLFGCYFGGDNIFYFSEALRANTSIASIHLSLCSDMNMNVLCNGLKHNNTIKFLNLGHCDILDEDIVVLVDALKNNYTLISIDVSFNKITFEGYKYMINNLKVQKLIIGNNSLIEKEQKLSLYESLYNNFYIKELEIDNFCSLSTDRATENFGIDKYCSLSTVESVINRNIVNIEYKSKTLVDIAEEIFVFPFRYSKFYTPKDTDDHLMSLSKGIKKLNEEIFFDGISADY